MNQIHLENMLALTKMGTIILPPMPAFYNQPSGLDEMVDHIVFRTLDQFGIRLPEAKRWNGIENKRRSLIMAYQDFREFLVALEKKDSR